MHPVLAPPPARPSWSRLDYSAAASADEKSEGRAAAPLHQPHVPAHRYHTTHKKCGGRMSRILTFFDKAAYPKRISSPKLSFITLLAEITAS